MSDSSRNSSDEASDSSDFSRYEVELREGILGVTEAEPLDGVIQPWRFEPQGSDNVENDEAEPEGHEQDEGHDGEDINERMGNTGWYT